MKFHPLSLSGAYSIEIEPKEDERGFFARSFCEHEFAGQGLISHFPQCNISYNQNKGTLRGMHYSIAPFAETKLIRCTKGSIFDVLIDLRCDSPTFHKWQAIELNEKNRKILYVPEGIAHGFQSLEDNSEVFYHMSVVYSGPHARGIRWDDPAFQIPWPINPPIISPKDRELPITKFSHDRL